jgi:hypothetical protein
VPYVFKFSVFCAAVVMVAWPGLAWLEDKFYEQGATKRRMIALIGMLVCVVGFVYFGSSLLGFLRARNPASVNAAVSEDSVARLSALGWTIKPDPKNTTFQISGAALPDMEQSAVYFKNYAKPFNVQLQNVPSLSGLDSLSGLNNCTGIQISAGDFTDISELSGFTHLQSLEMSQIPLNGTAVVDLTPLRGLIDLTNLNLSMVRTRTIAPIAGLINIKSLYLANTLITDISVLSGLSKIESLNISSTRVRNLAPIANDRHLSALTIGAMQAPALSDLSRLQNLKTLLIIDQIPINLRAVANLRNLETLNVLAGNFPLDLEPIGMMEQLSSLTITCMGMPFNIATQVSHADAIGNLHDLKSLTLGGVQVSDLTFLSSLQKLTSLSLSSVPIISLAFAQNLQYLQNVSLINIQIIDVSPLLSLPALSTLTVGRVPARSDVISELQRRGVIVTSF